MSPLPFIFGNKCISSSLRLILLLLLLCIYHKTKAQEFTAINFNIESGLPSNQAYDLYQDELGKIWITTDRGLVKFDGQNFTIYNASNKLNCSVVHRLFVQSSTQVWITNTKNELFMFNPKDKEIEFTPYQFKETLDSLSRMDSYSAVIYNVWFDSLSSLHFSFLRNSGQIIIDKEGNGKLINRPPVLKPSSKLHKTRFALIYDLTGLKPYAFLSHFDGQGQNIFTLINNANGEKRDLTPININHIEPSHGLAVFEYFSDTAFFIFKDRFIIASDSHVKDIRLQSNGLAILRHQNFIFIATFKGIEIYDNEGNFCSKQFADYFITSLMLDYSGKIWFTTLRNGLFVIPDYRIKYIRSVNHNIGNIRAIHVDSSFLHVFTVNMKLHVLNRQYNTVEEHSGVSISKKSKIVSSTNNTNLDSLFNQPFDGVNNEKKYPIFVYTLLPGEDSPYYATSRSIIVRYQKHIFDTISAAHIPPVNDVCEITPQVSLLATNKGLYKLTDFKIISPLHSKKSVLNQRLLRIKKTNKYISVTTEDSGLILIHNGVLKPISKSSGLVSNQIITEKFISENELWVGTSNGLSRIVINDFEQNAITISNYTTENGLPSDQIIDINYFNDSLWIATNKGICYFPLNLLKENVDLTTYPILIDSVIINYNSRIFDQELIIHESDILELYVSQVSFGVMNSIHYEYRIKGYLPNWIESKNGHFLVNGLTHGDYALEFRSIKKNGDKSKIESILIKVETPWYKVMTVRLLFILALLFLSFSLYKWLFSRIKKRNDLKVEKVNLELKALLAQMNPHFTFNTINSIQSFILHNNKKEALDYLSDFALLIRTSLDFSRKEVVHWSEEKAFLKLYVSLESERFEQNIVVSFEENFTSPYKTIGFPPLLLQPLVENAIIHGIQGAVDTGEIKISIRETKNAYEVSISNNGNPFGKLDEYKKYQSHGLDILKRRIALYNGTENEQLSIAIIRSVADETVVSLTLRKILLHVS